MTATTSRSSSSRITYCKEVKALEESVFFLLGGFFFFLVSFTTTGAPMEGSEEFC